MTSPGSGGINFDPAAMIAANNKVGASIPSPHPTITGLSPTGQANVDRVAAINAKLRKDIPESAAKANKDVNDLVNQNKESAQKIQEKMDAIHGEDHNKPGGIPSDKGLTPQEKNPPLDPNSAKVKDAANSEDGFIPITPELLKKLAPKLSDNLARAYAKGLTEALINSDINTPSREAMFIAQIAHETDHFQTLEEYASGSEYEGRKELGNIYPGDGVRYKGRGFIQLTGRSNYASVGEAIGMGDTLVRNPQIVSEDPRVATLVSINYWDSRNINKFADQGDIEHATRLINGGYNGLAERIRLYNIVKKEMKL